MDGTRINRKVVEPTEWSVVRRCALGAAALALAIVTHGTAHASCGDYVLVRNAEGRLVPASSLTAENRLPSDHAREPVRSPCRGPACSQRSDVPPAAPLAPITWPVAPEGLLTQVQGDGERPGSDGREPAAGALHPIHHPGRIFRPPR